MSNIPMLLLVFIHLIYSEARAKGQVTWCHGHLNAAGNLV